MQTSSTHQPPRLMIDRAAATVRSRSYPATVNGYTWASPQSIGHLRRRIDPRLCPGRVGNR